MSQAPNAIERHIRPALGVFQLSRLTTERIEEWQHSIATAPPLVRASQKKLADNSAKKLRARKKAKAKKLTAALLIPRAPRQYESGARPLTVC
jgi:hypothetical protein